MALSKGDVTTAVNPTTAVRKRYKVKTIGGQEIELLTTKEKQFYETARDKYKSENVFNAASDDRALDRLLLFETQVFRWQWQLAAGMDYDGVDLEASEATELRRAIKDTENLISELQRDLKLTKSQRDAAATADSVGEYIVNLKRRAKEHGIRRDAQIGKAIELMNELFSLAGSYERANEKERRKLGFESADDLIKYITEVIRPQFDEVDARYRAGHQKFWVRDL